MVVTAAEVVMEEAVVAVTEEVVVYDDESLTNSIARWSFAFTIHERRFDPRLQEKKQLPDFEIRYQPDIYRDA